MMEKMIIGRYIPGDSIIHRLDPRVKLIVSIYYVVIIFLANNWQSYLFLTIFTLGAVMLSKIKLTFFVKSMLPLIWLILFTVFLQVLYTSGGQVYWHWWILTISQYGLINGAFIFMRFTLIIFMSTLLTLSTPPLSIADGIESLLKPLLWVKFPVYEVALILSIALRFVPTLMDETQKIMNAQRARGVDFGEGNIFHQMKAIVPILIPLFISSFNRAEELGTAMEARGYQGGDGRSKFRVLKWHLADTVTLGVFALMTLVLFFIRA